MSLFVFLCVFHHHRSSPSLSPYMTLSLTSHHNHIERDEYSQQSTTTVTHDFVFTYRQNGKVEVWSKLCFVRCCWRLETRQQLNKANKFKSIILVERDEYLSSDFTHQRKSLFLISIFVPTLQPVLHRPRHRRHRKKTFSTSFCALPANLYHHACCVAHDDAIVDMLPSYVVSYIF